MTMLGPTILEEMKAAGVTDFRFTLEQETGAVTFHPGVDAQTRALVATVIQQHSPIAPLPDPVREAYLAAKAAIQEFAGDATIPAKYKEPVVKLAQCVKALILALNRQAD